MKTTEHMQSEAYATGANMSPADYLANRLEHKIGKYREKGHNYRWAYIWMASVAGAGAASVPVLINLQGVDKLYPTILSLLVTILVGLESLLHFREHWRNYDLMKAFLWQERNLYLTRSGVYKKLTPEECFCLLVERVESEIARERAETIGLRTSRDDPTRSKPIE